MCLFSISLHYPAHEADPVSGLIGMNSSTGGTTKDGGKWGIIKEVKNALGGETTSHNCYGVGTDDCRRRGLLENGLPMNWEPVYRPQKPININNDKPSLDKITEME